MRTRPQPDNAGNFGVGHCTLRSCTGLSLFIAPSSSICCNTVGPGKVYVRVAADPSLCSKLQSRRVQPVRLTSLKFLEGDAGKPSSVRV